MADDAAGGSEPRRLARLVDLAPQDARLRRGASPGRIDIDPPHGRQVDDDSPIAYGRSGHIVTAATDGGEDAAPGCEPDGGGYITGMCAPHDGGRPAVDRAVPDSASTVVLGVGGGHHPTADAGVQFCIVARSSVGKRIYFDAVHHALTVGPGRSVP
jgi:hypothetical protein